VRIMADRGKVGLRLPPITLKVEGVKIKELVEAIGDPNPIYRDREAAIAHGYRDTPCPPTFGTLAMQEFCGGYFRAFEALGISLSKVLHGEEEYEYLGEIYPGDVLTCSMTVDSIAEKQTKTGLMDLVTLRTVFTNQEGREVLRARSLIIERK
jgi:acyl dehydratase